MASCESIPESSVQPRIERLLVGSRRVPVEEDNSAHRGTSSWILHLLLERVKSGLCSLVGSNGAVAAKEK